MYEIALRDPFHDMRRLMRRHFVESFPSGHSSGAFSRRPRDRFSERRFWRPALTLDVSETEDGLTIEAGLPGFAADEVAVGVEGRILTIRAAKHGPDDTTDDTTGETADEATAENGDAELVTSDRETYVIRERSTQGLERRLRIGRAYDPDTVAAGLKDGLLTITIGKTPAARSHAVEIAVS